MHLADHLLAVLAQLAVEAAANLAFAWPYRAFRVEASPDPLHSTISLERVFVLL